MLPGSQNSGHPFTRASLAACCSRSVPLHQRSRDRFWKPREAKVQPEHLRTLFENGELWLDKADVPKRLQSLAKIGRTAAYDALKLIGDRYS